MTLVWPRSDSPTDVGAYKLVEANSMVEEFMLLANVQVATRLLKTYPALTLLRHHPPPPLERFESLIVQAALAGFAIDASSSKALASSLDAAEDPEDPYTNKLLRILATRCMRPAKYFCSNDKDEPDWAHYGLAAKVYTHFTSPIRRYADVVAHRLLAAAIGFAPLPPALGHADAKAELARVAANLNQRNQNAQLASRASIALYTRLFFKEHPQRDVEARILGLAPDKINVLVPRYGVEASLYLAPQHISPERLAKQVTHDDQKHRVTWTDAGGETVMLKVFDAIRVSIDVAPPTSAADDVGTIRIKLLVPHKPYFEPELEDRHNPESTVNSNKRGNKCTLDDDAGRKRRRPEQPKSAQPDQV